MPVATECHASQSLLRTLRFWHEIPADQYVDKFVAPHPSLGDRRDGNRADQRRGEGLETSYLGGWRWGVELSPARSSVFADFRRRGYLLQLVVRLCCHGSRVLTGSKRCQEAFTEQKWLSILTLASLVWAKRSCHTSSYPDWRNLLHAELT
jgi:hypothetical protein